MAVTGHDASSPYGTADLRIVYHYGGTNPYLGSSSWPIVISPNDSPTAGAGVAASVSTIVHDDVRYLTVDGGYVYQFAGDADGTTANGVGEFWTVMSSDGTDMTSFCAGRRLSARRKLVESQVDVSGCGASGRETYMAQLEVQTTDAAVYAAILNTMRAQIFADQTGNDGDFEDLAGSGTGLTGVTQLRNANNEPVYICGRPQVQVATQLIYAAPSTPPSPPPPAPPGTPFTVVGTTGAFTATVNHNKDYWIHFDGGYLAPGDIVVWTHALPLSGLPGCADAANPLLYPLADVTAFHYGGAIDAAMFHSVRLEGSSSNHQFHACIKKVADTIYSYRNDLVLETSFEPPSAPPPPLSPPHSPSPSSPPQVPPPPKPPPQTPPPSPHPPPGSPPAPPASPPAPPPSPSPSPPPRPPSPPSPPPSPPRLPPPLPPPPVLQNYRVFVGYGSILSVLVIASVLMPLTYLRRGIVLKQKDVIRVIEETPAPDEAVYPGLPPEAPDEPPPLFQPALVSVPLGAGGWKQSRATSDSRRKDERKSLLG